MIVVFANVSNLTDAFPSKVGFFRLDLKTLLEHLAFFDVD